MRYITGVGIPANPTEGFLWIKKSAEGGGLNAQANLGYLYRHGNGVAKDYSAALYWLQKAAEQDSDMAQFQLSLSPMRPQHDRNEQKRQKCRDDDTLKAHVKSPFYSL